MVPRRPKGGREVRVPFSSYLPLEQSDRLYDLARRQDKRITELLDEAVSLLLAKHSRGVKERGRESRSETPGNVRRRG